MMHRVVGVALAAGCLTVAAAQDQPQPSVRGLASRMAAQAAAACQPTPVAQAVPECLRAPVFDAPFDEIGANSVLAPLDPSMMAQACFDPDFPPSLEVQQMVMSALEPLVNRYQLDSRWSGTTGSPRALTWSFIPDGLNIPNGVGEPAGNSNLFAQMDSKFAALGGRAAWIAQFQACFDRWAALTGLSYTRVTSGGNDWDDGAAWGSVGGATRGDLRIGMKNIDGNSGILGYNFFPTTGLSPGDMVLDSSEGWQGGSPGFLFLRNVIFHEHGHGMGLRHVCPVANTKLMEPFLSTAFNGPQQDDLRAAQRHYGDAYESNNSAGTASPIGAATVGGTLDPSAVPAPAITNGALTAISVDGDVDFYSLTTAAPIIANITVTPLGSSYADAAQSSPCNEVAPVTNAASIADLAVDLLDSAGAIQFSTAAATGVGAAETISGALLSPPGTLMVRVRETNSPTQTQLYRLQITGVSTPTITASDNTFGDRVQLDWTSIAGATLYNIFRGTTNVRAAATLLASPVTNSHPDTTAVPGTTYFYWAEVVTSGGVSRPVAGPDSGVRQVTGPANDNCSAAIPVSSGSVTIGSLAGATNEGNTPGACGSSATNPDVWYSFTAPAACGGELTVTTCGTNDTGGLNLGTDTVVTLYSTCGGPILVCNDDAANGTLCAGLDAGLIRDSHIVRGMAAGETVLIRVSRFSTTTGTAFILRADFAIPNDLCAAAATIATATPTAFCNNGAGTDGPAEVLCDNFGDSQVNGDLWYRWTAPTNGRFNTNICTNGFDTKLAVYPGVCPAAPGTVLACNDDACGTGGRGSRTSAIGTVGASYLIRVGGFSTLRGSATVVVFCAPDINQSGIVSVQDIFDFLERYFAGDPSADFNGGNGNSVQDIFDFLEAYFTGC